jgi:hypothetical protein
MLGCVDHVELILEDPAGVAAPLRHLRACIQQHGKSSAGSCLRMRAFGRLVADAAHRKSMIARKLDDGFSVMRVASLRIAKSHSSYLCAQAVRDLVG